MPGQLTLQQINTLDRERFVAALGSLFEGQTWILAAVWERRPFGSIEDLWGALRDTMEKAPEERQVNLLRAHPDLVGRAARAGTLSQESTAEQAAAGLNRLTQREIAAVQELNARYRAKFDFPFVICARENTKDSILSGFAARLPHTREREIQIALGEVAKICWLRLEGLVRDT